MHRSDTNGFFLRIGLFAVIILSLVIKSYAEEPNKTIEHETGFYYTVQEGDTLWDISQHFNDTPDLWPELWKENDQISNPHWIYPGERIRLYHGMGKHKYQEDQVSQISTEEKPLQSIKTPPPQSLEPIVTEKYVYFAGMNQVGFIRKEPVETVGKIFRVQGEKKLISTGDTVYIKPPNHTESIYLPGSRYTIYRTFAPTKDRKSIKRIGTQYYLLGVLEVVKNETGYAIAKVIDVYREISIGDKLMLFVERPVQLPVIETTSGIDGHIIVSEDHNEIMGENAIAFINKGEIDNILPGQNYEIYYRMKQSKNSKDDDTMALAPIKIGSLVVLHTEKETSTVLIYDSSQSITAGEKFHASHTTP